MVFYNQDTVNIISWLVHSAHKISACISSVRGPHNHHSIKFVVNTCTQNNLLHSGQCKNRFVASCLRRKRTPDFISFFTIHMRRVNYWRMCFGGDIPPEIVGYVFLYGVLPCLQFFTPRTPKIPNVFLYARAFTLFRSNSHVITSNARCNARESINRFTCCIY